MKGPERVLVALLLTGQMTGTLRAQQVPTGIDSTARSAATPSGLKPWTPGKPAVARTLVEITFINAISAGINTIARDIVSPSPHSWWQNIQGGWSWDPNDIRVNHIEHPWAGSAYFNSARANGLSFWGAAPMALTGSLMWELFGEAKPPSTNDLLSTTLGGVAIGEPLQRLSMIMLDEESTGLDRLWRELAVFITNPGLGLNRLSRGQSWSRRQNPPLHRPEAVRGGTAFGVREFRPSDSATMGTPVLSFALDYGDPFAKGSRGPFSWFSGSMELMTSSPDGLGTLRVRGMLSAFGDDGGVRERVGGIFMDFDYRRDGVVEFAEQSFGVGLMSRAALSGALRLATDVSAEAVPILAVRDPYGKPLTGRRYDYGAGVGARAGAGLEYRGRRFLSVSGRAYWGPTLNGASESKLVQLANAEVRLPLRWSLSAGAGYQLYRQVSRYAERPNETQRVGSLTVFLSSGY